MTSKGNAGVHDYYKQLASQLSDMVFLIRGDLSPQVRVTIGELCHLGNTFLRKILRNLVLS